MISVLRSSCLAVFILLVTSASGQLLDKKAPFEIRMGVNHSNIEALDNQDWMGANVAFLLLFPIEKIYFITGLDFQLIKHEEIEPLPPRGEDRIVLKNKGLVSIPVMIRYPFFGGYAHAEGGLSLDILGIGAQAGLGFRIPVRGDYMTLTFQEQYSLVPGFGDSHFDTKVSNDILVSKVKLGIMIVKKKKKKYDRRVTH